MISPGLYCDKRLGGKHYYAYEPPDWKMRIPNDILTSVCFLGVELSGGPNAGKFYSFGTGFIVTIQKPPYYFPYLVTARHVVDEAQRGGYGNLVARFNKRDGTAATVKLVDNDKWIKMADPAVDLAVTEVPVDSNIFDCASIGMGTLASAEIVRNYGIGPGDEIFTVGLFALKAGNQRNIPIVRSGIIAAMPQENEPFATKDGKPYHAYLVELRSIGGLSGSPVFVFIDTRNRVVPFDGLLEAPSHDWMLFCIGVIRGHWDLKRDTSDAVLHDIGDVQLGVSKGENLNTGIAIVTPSPYVTHILNHEKLEARRGGFIEMKKREEAGNITEDSSQLPRNINDEPLTKQGFHDVLQRVSRKVSGEEQDIKSKQEPPS